MNKARRKTLAEIATKLGNYIEAITGARRVLANVKDKLSIIKDELDCVMEEERDALLNIPESFQDTDRYYESDEAVMNMDSAKDSIEEVVDGIEDIIKEITKELNAAESASDDIYEIMK